jgi:hypothetical protein
MTPLLQTALLRNAAPLAAGLDAEVARSMRTSYAVALGAGKAPTEPDFVALLVTQAAPAFVNVLQPVLTLAGVRVHMTAVFCHGRPEVAHAGNRCELGDVLFAHLHADANGQTHRRALLLQAKMSASPILSVGSSERHQLGLYTQWGPFTYRRTSPLLNGQTRTVTPRAAHDGAQYLLVDSRGPTHPASGVSGAPGTYPMGTAPAQLHLAIQASLGASLVQLMAGSDGRMFSDRSSAVADWDQVVWDLLRYGAQANFNQRRVGVRGRRRGVDVILDLALSRSVVQAGDSMPGGDMFREIGGEIGDQPPSSIDDERPRDEDGGGISLVVIETREARG